MTQAEKIFGRGCKHNWLLGELIIPDVEYEVCSRCGEDPKDCICELRYCQVCGDELLDGQCIRCKAEDYNRWYTKQNGFHGVNEYVNQERARQKWGVGAGHYDGLD
jgi:hypothetical protein